MHRRSFGALLTIALVAVAIPADARRCAGASFPDTVTVDGHELVLNGLGVREATIFNVNVYVAGLYVEERGGSAAELIGAEKHTRLVLKLVRDIDAETMNEGIERGFRLNAGDRLSAMQPRIRRLTSWFPDLPEGMVITFTYRPDQGIEVLVNGRRKGVIEGADFAEIFFNIWLGPDPPNRGLKRGLLGGRCSG